MDIITTIQKSLEKFRKREPVPVVDSITEVDNAIVNDIVRVKRKPAGRTSVSEYDTDSALRLLGTDWSKPEFLLEHIVTIRKLVRRNEDMGSVYNDLIQLTNTGHNISFDPNLPKQQIEKMRKHLENKRSSWGSGVHGIDGLINKWIGQIWVSGALSNEWVVAMDLGGLTNAVLVNPENILFRYNRLTTKFEPYQKVKNKIISDPLNNVVKLNTATYFYAGILGDTDSPYGIPPFLTALEAIADQKLMKKNIQHILKQIGLLGYLEVKVDKPLQEARESIPAYTARLDNFLRESKKSVQEGFAEGVVVGYEDDHSFDFHSTTKNITGVSEMFNMNEVQIANGLKTSPSFIGQKSGGTETNMGIVFTKMLSQLKSIQQIVATNLSMGYLLELQLAGFNVNYVNVEFKTSTITDDLKLWQAKEIKQRVLHNLRIDGIVSQEKYADDMGYDKPHQPEPLVPYDQQIGKAKDPEQKANREKGKDTSDRKGRDKNKPQPKRKDRETKPR